jgi:TRAP-type C4-dicarboxylate transport system substrate-binding protein
MQQVGEAPLMGVNALPYLAVGYDEAWTLNEIARPYYEEIAADNNQVILYDVAWPGGQVYADRAIETRDDFSGVRIRTADSIQSQFFDELGASTVQMPWGDVVPGLASGVIDGVTTSTSSGVDGAFWEFLGHMTIMDYVNPISVMAVNLDAWDALSDEHQEAIRAVADEMRPEFWARSEADDEEKLAKLEDEGISVSTVEGDLHDAMVDSGQAIWDDFIADVGTPAEEIITEYRSEIGR